MTASIGKRNGVGAILRVEAHGFLAWGAWNPESNPSAFQAAVGLIFSKFQGSPVWQFFLKNL